MFEITFENSHVNQFAQSSHFLATAGLLRIGHVRVAVVIRLHVQEGFVDRVQIHDEMFSWPQGVFTYFDMKT